jgi:hypothetical protein
MVKFEFKQANQDKIPHYRPLALATGSSAQPDSKAGTTACAGQATALVPTRLSMSPRAGGSA